MAVDHGGVDILAVALNGARTKDSHSLSCRLRVRVDTDDSLGIESTTRELNVRCAPIASLRFRTLNVSNVLRNETSPRSKFQPGSLTVNGTAKSGHAYDR